MTSHFRPALGVLAMVVLVGAPAIAQQTSPRAVLTVPATGMFGRGGEFRGTISINRFEQRGTDIVAIGFVSGVLSRASKSVGTATAGEVAWPVRIAAGGVTVANGRERERPIVRLAIWSGDLAESAGLRRVQAEVCPVVNLGLAPITVDLLGVQVALSGIEFDLNGVVGTPLGDLVCAVSDLLGNVAALVQLLNSILGLLTGLLGGLAGGIGGAVPGL